MLSQVCCNWVFRPMLFCRDVFVLFRTQTQTYIFFLVWAATTNWNKLTRVVCCVLLAAVVVVVDAN